MKPSDPYSRYELQLGKLHALDREGRLDSDEADELRDAMSPPWDALSPAERARLQGLSHDLYSLNNEEVETESAPPPRDGAEREQLMAQAAAAYEGHRWEDLLLLLRRLRPEFPPPLIAYMRARCWYEMGRFEPATWFFTLSARLDPKNERYTLLALDAEFRSSRREDAFTHAKSLLHRESAELRIGATRVASEGAKALPPSEAQSLNEEIVTVLRAAIKDVEDGIHEALPSLLLAARLNLALVLERLGQPNEALKTYEVAIAKNPESDELIAARGLFYLGQQELALARQDFERLVNRGRTTLAAPYLILGRLYLDQGHNERVMELATEAIARSLGYPKVLADAYECKAIAAARLLSSPDEIRRLFQAAVQHDPMNERIRRNLELFEDRLKQESNANAGFKFELSRLEFSRATIERDLQRRLEPAAA